MLDTQNDTANARDSAVPIAGVPVVERAGRMRRRLIDRISGFEALAIFAAWLVSTTWLTAIAPAPDPVQPPLIVALNVAFNVGFFGALIGAAARRRFALAGSVVAGAAIAIMATFCGLEGHTGLWIPAQFAVGAGFLAYGSLRLRT